MIESENRKSYNQNRKIEIGIIEAEIRIEATKLSRRIVTALQCQVIIWELQCLDLKAPIMVEFFSAAIFFLRANKQISGFTSDISKVAPEHSLPVSEAAIKHRKNSQLLWFFYNQSHFSNKSIEFHCLNKEPKHEENFPC